MKTNLKVFTEGGSAYGGKIQNLKLQFKSQNLRTLTKTFAFFILIFNFAFLVFNLPSFAEVVNQDARVIYIKGDVSIQKDGQKEWKNANLDDVIKVNDSIKTEKNSFAKLQLIEKGDIVNIDQATAVKILKLEKDTITNDNQTLLDVAMGSVLISADKLKSKQSKFEVNTPNVIVGVRGTRFEVKVAK